jgi:hypothetical protein
MGNWMGLLFDGRGRSLDEVFSLNGLILPWVLGGWMGGRYGGGVMWVGSISGTCLGEGVYRGEGDRPIAVG